MYVFISGMPADSTSSTPFTLPLARKVPESTLPSTLCTPPLTLECLYSLLEKMRRER